MSGAASALAADILKKFPESAPRYLAAAPIRLDVMSGLADYTGALVVQMPLADHVCTAVQPRKDQLVSFLMHGEDGAGTTWQVSTTDLRGAVDLSPAEAVGTVLSAVGESRQALLVFGVLIEALRSGLVSDLGAGFSLVSASTVSHVPHVGQEAALAAATLTALCGATGLTPEVAEAAVVCHRAVNDWARLPVGMSDIPCALAGECDTLMQLYCDPCTIVGGVPMPERLALAGVHCGAVHAGWRAKFEQARTATFMGRLLIDKIIKHEGGNHAPWDGKLARISVVDYVERFRDRIPTKFKGSEFLSRFGETGDPLTTIDPAVSYKIRSRTEHHIYEHMRSSQFIECLRRGTRTGDDAVLDDLTKLMHASHWSYGQRCGLGSVETDLLANLIRQHGRNAGVVGCRLAGWGSGGVITVLMRTSQQAEDALRSAIADYEQQTGKKTRLLRGSGAGAMHAGVRQF